ncbi:Adipolin [Merluccius polli]|uniref:Adipolin n=1 Tax=Merluccius polli TaxID=89951 RepID=A0AA47N3R9_MERPO|nr:Adipolin [Merluccius polli]
MIVGLESNSKIFTVSVQGLLELQAGQYTSIFVDNAAGASITIQSGSDYMGMLLVVLNCKSWLAAAEQTAVSRAHSNYQQVHNYVSMLQPIRRPATEPPPPAKVVAKPSCAVALTGISHCPIISISQAE